MAVTAIAHDLRPRPIDQDPAAPKLQFQCEVLIYGPVNEVPDFYRIETVVTDVLPGDTAAAWGNKIKAAIVAKCVAAGIPAPTQTFIPTFSKL